MMHFYIYQSIFASYPLCRRTHDGRIRYKPNELAAVVEHRVALLVMIGHAPYAKLAALPLIYVQQKSVDWLNHRIIDSQAVGEPADGKDVSVIAGKKTRRVKHMAFHSDMHWTLGNFDAGRYIDHADATPGLCGYFDERSHYEGKCQPRSSPGG